MEILHFTFFLYNPLGVTIAAFSWVFVSIATCQEQKKDPNVENHLEPLNLLTPE